MFATIVLVLFLLSFSSSFLLSTTRPRNKRKFNWIRCSTSEIDTFPQLFEGDVVEYIVDSMGPFLGAISLSGPRSSTIKINQLCVRESYLHEEALAETKDICLYEHMDKASVTHPEHDDKQQENIRVRILARWPDVEYTQRMVEDRVSNPHGEHAENVWLIPVDRFRKRFTHGSIQYQQKLIIEMDSSGH